MKLQDLDFLGSRVLSNLTGEHREEKKSYVSKFGLYTLSQGLLVGEQ